MILKDKTDLQLLEILAWPGDYKPEFVKEALEAFRERRLNKTKSKKLVRAFLEEKVGEMLDGVRRLDEVDRIPESHLFSRKEIESCIRRVINTKKDKAKVLRDNSNGGDYISGAF